jgi:hypothetical protein
MCVRDYGGLAERFLSYTSIAVFKPLRTREMIASDVTFARWWREIRSMKR